MGIEDRFKNKRDIEQRIKKIKVEIGELPDVNSLKVEAAEWNTRVESFIHLHGGGSEAAIDAKRKTEFVDIQRKAKEARGVAERAWQHLNRLLKDLAELEGQLERMDIQVTIRDLITLHEKLQSMEEDVSDLQHAIASEKEKLAIADTNTGHSLVELSQHRENLLANIATGVQVDSDELKEVDKRIAKEEKLHTELVDGVITASQTINGLKRRLEGTESNLSQVKENYRCAFSTFLVQEMERAGKKYSKLGLQLGETFMQIVSLSELQQQYGAPVNIFGTYTYQCRIPSFNLESCKIAEPSGWPGVLFNYDTADKSIALEKERDRIKKLCISVPC